MNLLKKYLMLVHGIFLSVFLFSGFTSKGIKHKLEYYKHNTRKADTVYLKETETKKLFLLVMKPDKKSGRKYRSAIVWIHGGGWTGGHAGQFIPHIRYTADRGAVGFSVNYRLIRKKNTPDDGNTTNLIDCISDCRDAIKFIREHKENFEIDPEKIVVIGDSAGGHLAMCMGILDAPVSSKANAVVDCNGITDFSIEKWQEFLPHKKDLKSEIREYSPLFNLDKNDPPLLVLNGRNDKVVKAEESEKLYQTAKKVGIDTEFILFEDMKHAFILTDYTASEEQTTKAILAIDKFLVQRKFLKGYSMLVQP